MHYTKINRSYPAFPQFKIEEDCDAPETFALRACEKTRKNTAFDLFKCARKSWRVTIALAARAELNYRQFAFNDVIRSFAREK